MATIWRALATAIFLVWGYVVVTGTGAGASAETLAWHLNTGLVAVVAAALVQSLPFAYFLGTHFWVKAFVRASRADESWEARHKQWMKGRAYPAMYLAPMLTMAVAIVGGLTETGRLPAWLHPSMVVAAIGTQLVALLLVPAEMLRISALMDELAETHCVAKPGTPEMDELIEEESQHALPPLFQLSRVLMFFAVQCVFAWLYLRFGTDGWRGVPFAPFAVLGAVLFTVGLGLNARHDPDAPASSGRAWGRAIAIGGTAGVVLLWVGRLL